MKADRNTIIDAIRKLATQNKVHTMTRGEFTSQTGISAWRIYEVFDGGWREAVEAAGLTPHYQNVPIDDDALFHEMHRVFLLTNGVCSTMRFNRESRYSLKTYTKRFKGKWENVLLGFRDWLDSNKVAFQYKDQLTRLANDAPEISRKSNAPLSSPSQTKQWGSVGGSTFGSFLNFRGLQHAPVNEQGVVFLFGMVCFDLGYVVESVRTSFPDCEAKRCIDRKHDKWERVRIEFEFKARHFIDHGHDSSQCDLIVCWENDWPDCPLEILELKSALKAITE